VKGRKDNNMLNTNSDLKINLDAATRQLSEVTAERETIRTKIETARAKLKGVALAAFRQDPAATKAQKLARAELEDAEFALQSIDLAVESAQLEVTQRQCKMNQQQLREVYDQILAKGDRRAKLWEKGTEQLSAAAATYHELRAVGAEIRSMLASLRNMPVVAGFPSFDTIHRVSTNLGDTDNFAACVVQCLPHDVFMRLPEDHQSPRDFVETELNIWGHLATDIAED
jgi:hypothetical protein